jgi:hypothetical protein
LQVVNKLDQPAANRMMERNSRENNNFVATKFAWWLKR